MPVLSLSKGPALPGADAEADEAVAMALAKRATESASARSAASEGPDFFFAMEAGLSDLSNLRRKRGAEKRRPGRFTLS